MKMHSVILLIATLVFIGGGIYIVSSGRLVNDVQPSDFEVTTQTDQGVTETINTDGLFSMDVVSAHAEEGDCWSVVHGAVYDLTSWVSRHPGGSDHIIEMCGIDASSIYDAQHEGEGSAERALILLKIGDLE